MEGEGAATEERPDLERQDFAGLTERDANEVRNAIARGENSWLHPGGEPWLHHPQLSDTRPNGSSRGGMVGRLRALISFSRAGLIGGQIRIRCVQSGSSLHAQAIGRGANS